MTHKEKTSKKPTTKSEFKEAIEKNPYLNAFGKVPKKNNEIHNLRTKNRYMLDILGLPTEKLAIAIFDKLLENQPEPERLRFRECLNNWLKSW